MILESMRVRSFSLLRNGNVHLFFGSLFLNKVDDKKTRSLDSAFFLRLFPDLMIINIRHSFQDSILKRGHGHCILI